MDFQTKVRLPENELKITHKSPVFVIGSCFAEHIGEWLLRAKFDCMANPYGVLYNPMSILVALEEMASGKVYTEDNLFLHEGLWHSWLHHSSYSSPDKEEVLRRINHTIGVAHERLSKPTLLVLTWGTNHVYYLKETPERPVGNCHKVPQNFFEERHFSVEALVGAYTDWLERHPTVKVLLTVSPIRYKKYGFHESNLSKAVLLLAQQELCERFKGRCFYFPAYEILMDELRDYRFYDEDMVHPSPVAIEYVKECFAKCYFSAETQQLNHECLGVAKALSHRPLHPETDVYQCFLRKIVLRIQTINEKYPYLSGKFENELRLCHTLLKQ